jgi:hypothetical protein
MLKRMFFIITTILATPSAFGMFSYENTAISSAQSQLEHIKAQMLSIKKAWNISRIHIKTAEKASFALYQQIKPIFDKIIASDAFTTRLNDAVTNQADAITNLASFESVKSEFNLSDFVPNATMTDFGRKLFSAMANRVYYLDLGKKLAQKAQELALVIATSRPVILMPQE